ncbi:glycerophosphodiester phosphodiesterase [Janibacter sp. G1551]|uniref:glycerophosphodiester phosphodiesterase n=1 Tax=Janibacter sp. G1551 TaxID=3420440 RepID=UPI003CFDD909
MTRMRITLAAALSGLVIVPAAVAPATAAPHSKADSSASNARQFTDPLVIAHRGASGYRPEHTLAAYELAVQMGADYIEPDLVMTKDGVPVDRHEPEISGTTDVSAHPEFASRKTTKMLDGVATTGWFTEDFTLAELKTLRAKERLGAMRPVSQSYDGQFEVPTFREVLEFREYLEKKYKRKVGIIPEIKHSTYFVEQGVPAEAPVVDLVKEFHLNRPSAPLSIQSFELSNLIELREEHCFKAGAVFLTTVKGAPYDLVAKGDPRTYAQLTSAESLGELNEWITGLGPEKNAVIARKADGTLGEETTLVSDAHAAGLVVTPWTFRAENTFLPVDYRSSTDPAAWGNMHDEAIRFMEADVDGLFCDQPDICVAAREEFLAGQ